MAIVPVKEYENMMEKIFIRWCGTFQLLFACLMAEIGDSNINQCFSNGGSNLNFRDRKIILFRRRKYFSNEMQWNGLK